MLFVYKLQLYDDDDYDDDDDNFVNSLVLNAQFSLVALMKRFRRPRVFLKLISGRLLG